MPELKRYDGNPSGHISMDTRAMAFAKETIHKEQDHMDKMRERGLDKSEFYRTQGRSVTAATVFPTPRIPPETDRELKLFRDFTAADVQAGQTSKIEHWMKFSQPGDGIEWPEEEHVDSEETSRRKLADAVERDRREYENMTRQKELIEREIEELENVIAYKRRKEIENLQKRSERPFACLPMTHRASYPQHRHREEWQNGVITTARKNEEKMKNKDVALTARISARLSSQEIGNHTDIAFQRRGKKVGSKR